LPARTALRLCAVLAQLLVLQMLGLVSTTAATASAPAPTVAITSPGSGATVEGTVKVEATATAIAGAYPEYITFYDGVNEIARVNCQSQATCTGFTEWHATGLTGQHSLTAQTETNEGAAATSAAVPVNVVSPLPTVQITSPGSSATVEGTINVLASAATDPSQVDYPTEIKVYDGVNGIGRVSCQGQRTCQGQVEWKATGLTGTHALTATVSTNRNVSVTSAPVDVTVLSPAPKVKITHPASGTSLRATDSVAVSGSTAPSQDEYPTEITVEDATSEIGSVRCQGQQTCAGSVHWNTGSLKGVQVLTAVIHTSRSREASSQPVYIGATASKRRAPVSCRIDSLRVRRRHYDHGSCSAHGVPKGTPVVVQYRVSGGSWTSGAKGSISASGQYAFKFRSRYRVTFEVSVLVGASSRYTATRVVLGTVHVS
jgi:hypothetical protein